MVARLDLEERKFILKSYWKYENAVEVQRQFRREFNKEPPTRVTITLIRDKFEADGSVQDVHKKLSQRPRTSTSPRNKKEQCDQCDVWFHTECIGISEQEAEALKHYKCPRCSIADTTSSSAIIETCHSDHCKLSRARDSKYCSPQCGMNFLKKSIIEKYLPKLNEVESNAAPQVQPCNCLTSQILDKNLCQLIDRKDAIRNTLVCLEERKQNLKSKFADSNCSQGSTCCTDSSITNQNKGHSSEIFHPTSANSQLTENYHICRICCQQIYSSRIQHHIRKCAIKTNANYQVPYELSASDEFKAKYPGIVGLDSIYCSQKIKKHADIFGCEGFPITCGHVPAPTASLPSSQTMNSVDDPLSNKSGLLPVTLDSPKCQYDFKEFDTLSRS
ncbi:MAG: hypothetical protein MHMPM18_002211, partial [Marteilia pararefringens]